MEIKFPEFPIRLPLWALLCGSSLVVHLMIPQKSLKDYSKEDLKKTTMATVWCFSSLTESLQKLQRKSSRLKIGGVGGGSWKKVPKQ